MTTDGEPEADQPDETEKAPADETVEADEPSPAEDAAEPVDGDETEEPADESAEDQEPEAEGGDDQAEEPAAEPGEGDETEPEAPEAQDDGEQADEPADEGADESGEEQEPEAETPEPETEEGDQAEETAEAPAEEEPEEAAEPEAGAEAPGEEAEPAPEPEIDADELPEGKRAGDEAEIDEGELGDQYELSEDIAGGAPEAEAEELASDLAPGAERIAIDQTDLGDETFVPSERKGMNPALIVIQILLFAAVVGMGYAVITKMNARKTSEEAESPATLDYEYKTKTGSPERAVEETIAPLDLGETEIASITLSGEKKSQCEIVLDLPMMYLGKDDLKREAEERAVAIVKAVLDGVASLEEITFKATGCLDDDDLEKREVALQVVASRAVHAKADYSGGPAAVLMLLKTTYHKALQ